jgi:homogentisate phytyltransferase/homogentisate geranylgeranyltransferase
MTPVSITRPHQWLPHFWLFARPHTIIGTSLSVFTLYLMAAADYGFGRYTALLLTWISCLGANVFIVGLNQLTDVAIDRINKPRLPLASGAFTMRMGWIVVTSCVIISLLIAFAYGHELLYTVVISLLIGTAYSLPPIRLKRFSFWAAACIFTVRGVVVNIFLYLHFQRLLFRAAELPAHIWLLTAFVFCLSLAIAWLKDLPDTEGDRRYQIATLSVRFGRKRVLQLTQLLLLLSYGGMVLAGFSGISHVNGGVLIVSHLLLGGYILWKSTTVALDDIAAITHFYMRIWLLFFAEYLIYTVAVWLA